MPVTTNPGWMSQNPGSKVRVGLVIGQLHFGGAERQLYELATRLPVDGFPPVVVSLSEDVNPYGPGLEERGITVRALRRRMHADPFRVRDLRRILVTERVGLVHAFLHTANAYCGAALGGRPDVPLLASVRNCEVDRPRVYRWIDRMVFRRSAAVLANSRAVRDFLIERYGLDAARIPVVHNGLDLSRFRPDQDRRRLKEALGFPPDSVLVGGIGRLEPQKRFDLFIDAALSLRTEFRRLCFLVVGEGRLKASLLTRIRENRLGSAFRILPPREDVESLYGAMDIFLLTSYKEGLPNVVMEAMAMALPCIVTDAGGSRELVREGATGHIVPLGREADIPGFLRALIGNPGLRRTMGENGRKRMEREFSAETMVEATVGVYSRILQGKDAVFPRSSGSA